MAAIGEISAIVGVLQAGFSLATTLHGYVGDYKDARDDIISLATEIEATLNQVQALNDLVKTNKAAKSLDDSGLKQADNCVTESDKLVKKIIKLLTKAGVPESPTQVVKPEDINVSRFTRAYWPIWYKPSVEVIKRQLDSLRIKILLARSCIEARSGPTAAARSEASSRIVGLARSKQLAQIQLRKAKAAQAKTMSQANLAKTHSGRPRVEERKPAISFADSTFSPPPRRSTNQSGFSVLSSDDGRDADAIAEKLREEIRQDIQQQDVERLVKEAAEKKAKELAVDQYKEDVKQRLLALQQHANETKRHLEAVFGATLNVEQVKQYVQEQSAKEMKDELGQLLLQTTAESKAQLVSAPLEEAASAPVQVLETRSRKGWFSRRGSTQRLQASIPASQQARLATRPSSLNTASDLVFAHLALTYSSIGGDAGTNECHPFDVSGVQHNPCGDHCDIDATMKVWAQVPRAAKDSALRCVNKCFGNKRWLLHSAYFRDQSTRGSRRLLQRALLGSVVSTGLINVLLTYSASNDDSGSEETKSGPGASKDLRKEADAEAASSRDGLTQPRAERLRKWLREAAWKEGEVEELMRYIKQGTKPSDEPPAKGATATPAQQVDYLRKDVMNPSRGGYPDRAGYAPPAPYPVLPYRSSDSRHDNAYERRDPIDLGPGPFDIGPNPFAPDGLYPSRSDTFDRGRSSYWDPLMNVPPPPPPPGPYPMPRPPHPPGYPPPGALPVMSMMGPDHYRRDHDKTMTEDLARLKKESSSSQYAKVRNKDRVDGDKKWWEREYELRKERERDREREIAELERERYELELERRSDKRSPSRKTARERRETRGGGEGAKSETRRGRSDARVSNGYLDIRIPRYHDHRDFRGRQAYGERSRRSSFSSSDSDSDLWSRKAHHSRNRRSREEIIIRRRREPSRSPSPSRVRFSSSPTQIYRTVDVSVERRGFGHVSSSEPAVDVAQESGSEDHSDEEDVVLSDDDLRKKMLVKYTGGNTAGASAGAEVSPPF